MTSTFIVAEINQAGRTALIEWLEANLHESIHAEAFADAMISESDFGDPELNSPHVELSGLRSRSGNPKIYRFDRWEYDAVTYNDDGDEVAREGGE